MSQPLLIAGIRNLSRHAALKRAGCEGFEKAQELLPVGIKKAIGTVVINCIRRKYSQIPRVNTHSPRMGCYTASAV